MVTVVSLAILAVAAVLAAAWWYALAVPGRPHAGPLPPATGEEVDLAARLERHVVAIASTPHNIAHRAALERAARYIEGVLEGGTVDGEDGALGGGGAGGEGSGEADPMYDKAVEIVLKNQKASISLVQRHLSIGYNKAANLLEAMEKAGLVSPMNARGQREILVPGRAE